MKTEFKLSIVRNSLVIYICCYIIATFSTYGRC